MTNSETQADIIAEMRWHIQAARDYPHDIEITTGDVEDWADRIEAAAKRERTALVAEAETAKDARNRVAVRLGVKYAERCRECKAKSGSAAAMREALIKIRNEIRSYCYDYGDGESHKALLDRIMNDHPDYTSYEKSILEIDRIVEAALAAPPRNCDRFSDLKSAQRFYIEHGSPKGLGFCVDGEIRKFPWKSQFEAWLFAKAEGGAE